MVVGKIQLLLRVFAASAIFAAALHLFGVEEELRTYDVPAGFAADTLKIAAVQGRIELVYAPGVVAGLSTRPVRGRLSAREALDCLLRDTPLVVVPANNGKAFGIVNRSSSADFNQNNLKNQHQSSSPQPSIDMPSQKPTLGSRSTHLITGILTAIFAGGSPDTSLAQAKGDQEESVYELSPFQVNAESDQGYVASQTLSGTRLNSKLRDIASTVTVLTKDLLDDTGSTTIQDFLIYTPNAEISGPGGNFANPTPGLDTAGPNRRRASGALRRPIWREIIFPLPSAWTPTTPRRWISTAGRIRSCSAWAARRAL